MRHIPVRARPGVTLVELLIVIAIIGLLSTMVVIFGPTLGEKQRASRGADQLQGIKLLGQNATLKTEDTIVLYFAALQKVRQKLPSKVREYKDPYFIDVRYFTLIP